MRQKIGKLGETIAKDYLLAKKYKILKTNWRYKGGEIDVIAISPTGKLSFIEVKTRRTKDFGLPEESVDYRKIRKILEGAKLFLCYNEDLSELEISFDIISITFFESGDFNIKHIQNAFSESDI